MSIRLPLAVIAVLAPLVVQAAGTTSQSATPPFFQRMLERWDTNHDGRISLDEYLAAASARFAKLDTEGKGSVDAQQIASSPRAEERMQHRAERIIGRLDKAEAGYATESEFVDAAGRRFARLDTNGDGRLTPDELQSAHQARRGGAGVRAGASRRFEQLDANHDGVVTRDEYIAAAKTLFQSFDAAGNDHVTAEEIARSPKAQQRAERVAERLVRRLDTNGDGVVSREEFLAAARQRFARRDANADGFLDAAEFAGGRHGHAAARGND